MIKTEIIETSSLGDRSYVAHDGEVAVVIDSQRDIDRVLDLAAAGGVRITHVLETHVHNDYVTGGLELAGLTGAADLLPAGSGDRPRRTQPFDGGITAYTAAGGEVIRGRPRWSLERQVRLVAGTLVLAGLAVGRRDPKARLLAAGIGAGLTMSALTDTCTLARILAALPYNRGPRDRTPEEVLAQPPTAEPAP